jgi:mRNA export factor
MFGAAAAAGGINPNKDVQITPPLADGVSSVAFSPRANILVATCWDNNVYCWEVASNGQAAPKASTSHTQPVLCSSWNADGSAVFTGSCDKTVKMWNLATNQAQQVAQHDAPVRHCAFIPENNLLVTGTLDAADSAYIIYFSQISSWVCLLSVLACRNSLQEQQRQLAWQDACSTEGCL